MSMDVDRFKSIAAGVQSIALSLAVVVGGIWTLYTFSAFEEIDRRQAELETVRRGLVERGILDIGMTTRQEPGDAGGQRYLVVTVEITNRGNRSEALRWDAGGLLAARTGIASDGRQVQGSPVQARYARVGGEPESSTILPGQTRRFPFLLGLDAAGMYLLQFEAEVSPLELPAMAAEHGRPEDDSMVYVWSETQYVSVR